MNWDAIGAIAELLGAVAVVVTLAYLSVQLRQNTASVRASSTAAHAEAQRSFNLVIAQDVELTRLYWSGLANRAALDDDDRRRFDFVMAAQVQSNEQLWKFRQEGVVDDPTWAASRAALSWFAHEPGFIEYWSIYGAMHHPGFAALVAEVMVEELSPELALAAQQSASADPSPTANQP